MSSDELWRTLISSEDIKTKYFIIGAAIDLFGEAIKCYDAQAYLASCVCVRAAIETALHIAKTRTIVGLGSATVNLKDTGWEELKDWARKEGLLDQELEARVGRSRELGNFGAHLAQRVDGAYRKQTSE